MRYKTHLLVGVAMLMSVAPGAAQPQSAATQVGQGGGDEILVTATRRAESIQKVPVAVQAISGEEIETRNLFTTTDIQFAAPSLTFTQGPGSTSANFSVRGVGTVGGAPSLEESVGLVVDGVVVSARGAGLTNMVDVQQVEVLRGPQGMLFGKNASAGLVTITSNAPDLEDFEVRAKASYGSYNDRRFQGMINAPLDGGRLGLRVTGLYTKRDPFQLNRTDGAMFSDQEESFVRGRLRFEPTDRLRIDLQADYDKSDSTCCQMALVYGDETNAIVQAILATGVTPGLNNIDSAHTPDVPWSTSTNSGQQAEVNYDLGPATVTMTLAHRWFRNDFETDADFSPVPAVVLAQTQTLDQYTQEVRLTSNEPLAGVVDYVIGFYGFQAESLRDRRQIAAATARTHSPVESRSYAGFGLATVNVSDQLRFLLGGRYTSDEVSQDDFSAVNDGPLNLVTGGTSSATNFSYKVGAQYDVTDDVMVFATVTEGYKGPAFSAIPAGGPGLPPVATPVEPELSTEYSIGLRSQFFQRALTANLTLFRQDFENYQAVTFDPNVLASYLRNAGAVRTQGVEWEVTLRPARGVSLSSIGGWVDAKHTDYPGVQCSPIFRLNYPALCPGGFIDATGAPLQNAPKFTNNFVAAYTKEFADRFALTALGSYSYRSEVNFLSTGDPFAVQPGYGLLNFTVGVGDIDGRWRLSGWVRNLTDKDFASGIIAAPNALGASMLRSVTLESGRTAGVSFEVRL